MKRFIFIGCDRLGSRGLERLAGSSLLAEYYELVGVITSDYSGENDQVVEHMARMLNLPVFNGKINTPECANWIEERKASVAAMMEYDQRIPADIINHFELFLNMHPSDLPNYRGGAPLQYTIMDNQPLVVSVHRVNIEFDAGDYLAKSEPLDISGLTMDAVNQLAGREGAILLEQTLIDAAEGHLQPKFQVGSPSLALEKNLADRMKINWQQDAGLQIRAKVLAGNHWWRPDFEGNLIIEAWFYPCITAEEPGTVLARDVQFIKIAVRDGIIITNININI